MAGGVHIVLFLHLSAEGADESKRNAKGAGLIRKRPDGRWEGRYTLGYDPKTGKQQQKYVYGKTQKEVRQKLTQIASEVDEGNYLEPSTMKFSAWLEMWLETYVVPAKKPYTVSSYENICRKYLIKHLGRLPISQLNAFQIQQMYNTLLLDDKLSPKTIKNIHGVLHNALRQAVKLQMIKTNPSEMCDLPRAYRKEIQPMEQEDIVQFLKALQEEKYARLYKVTLFTGMRQGEVLGLTWDCVDFENCTLYVNKQLQKSQKVGGTYVLVPTKNGKGRIVTVAEAVMDMLREEKEWQEHNREIAGSAWQNDWGLVFTNEIGGHLCHFTVYRRFKEVVKEIGLPKERFHDLRHSFAVVSLESGDDIKTVQANLGHATASFTLDVYGHVSQNMRRQSAERMNKFIKSVSA